MPLTHHARPLLNAGLKKDPTGTQRIWSQMADRAEGALRLLGRAIGTRIVRDNCLGIIPGKTVVNLYDFTLSEERLNGFMTWLEKEEDAGVLKIIRRPDAIRDFPAARIKLPAPWTDVYIDTAYQRGIRQAGQKLRAGGARMNSLDSFPGGMTGLMNQPVHADRVVLAFSRTYEALKSVTREMNLEIRATIAQELREGISLGLAEGKNPNVIARELVNAVGGKVERIGISRARMIARTEVLRAHHEATIAEYERAEAEMPGYHIECDWLLGADPCAEICIPGAAEGPYTVEEMDALLPAHVNCVCTSIPRVIKDEEAEAA